MRIGVDIMGGDYAPKEVVLGAKQVCQKLSKDSRIVLIGDEKKARSILKEVDFDPSFFDFVHTTEMINMGEHPAKSFSKKPNSSIALGFKLLKSKEIDGFASAGNTGAMLVGAMFTVKSIPGVIRPCIAAIVPRPDSTPTILLDVGLNPDCKPDILYQYAILGSIYCENVFNKKSPKVGLVNIGQEEEKGNLLTQAAYSNMKDSSEFNFVGNVEGNEILCNSDVDVLVCDGFVGNVILKQVEAIYTLIKKRGIEDDFFEQFNFERVGGTPILGINAPVVIGHGISKALAIENMILQTQNDIKANLAESFKKRLNND